jgi:beta-galactosidase
VLYTYENHYEFAEQEKIKEFSGPSGNGYALHLAKHFRAIAKNNIPVDIVYPGGDFSKYKCIIAPALYVLPEELGKKINAYIRTGGKFLLTCFSGVVDKNAKVWDVPVPGPVRAAFGIRVLDYGKYAGETGDLKLKCRKDKLPLPTFELDNWIDEVIPDPDTEILALYAGKYFDKTPVFTRNQFGRGEAYYLGTFLKTDDYSLFYKSFLELLQIKPMMDLPEGVHSSCRMKEGIRLYFISNETGETKEMELSGSYTEVITGREMSGRIRIPGFCVLILSTGKETR